MPRREFLQIGGLAALGAAVPAFGPNAAESAPGTVPGFGNAKAVIVVFTNGGQSQLETWDPKPEAPREVRGEFQAVPTAVPGTLVGENLPQLAKIADKYTIVRSMSHEDLDHGSAFYLSLTGHYHNRRSSNPPPQPEDYPTHGAVLKRVRPNRRFIHTAAHLNGPALVPTTIGPGQFGALLGRDFDPLVVGDVTAEPVVIPDLSPRSELSLDRLDARRSLLETLDGRTLQWERDTAARDMGLLYNQAFQMLATPAARKAFDLSAERAALRDRYGRNRSGQALLLARRLVEAGIPLVTVFQTHSNRGQDLHPTETDQYGWDTHNDIFYALKQHLLPRFDLGFSALLEDLDDRGLLDQTLVVCMGEFGRAPLVALERNLKGASPGRKHWAAVYSVVMAGAGVGRGKVLGASNQAAAYPTTEKYGPWDMTATIFSALGIDPHTHYVDSVGRPFPVSVGKPMIDLYS